MDVAARDRLYHSAWGIQTLAAFALVVIGRGPRIVLGYCVPFIVLFYRGRLLGSAPNQPNLRCAICATGGALAERLGLHCLLGIGLVVIGVPPVSFLLHRYWTCR